MNGVAGPRGYVVPVEGHNHLAQRRFSRDIGVLYHVADMAFQLVYIDVRHRQFLFELASRFLGVHARCYVVYDQPHCRH